jgi:hypothetical protein
VLLLPPRLARLRGVLYHLAVRENRKAYCLHLPVGNLFKKRKNLKI